MTKRFSIEEVREILGSEGYILLTNEYIDSRQSLKVKCSHGHLFEIKIVNFQRGSRCEECKKNEKLEEIRKTFKEKGYRLITDKYLDSKSRYEVICPNGHNWKVTIANFNHGRRCVQCKYEKAGETQRLSYDYVNEQISKEGYTLLSKEYNNAHELLEIECCEGHKFTMQWANWQQGYRCPFCNEKRSYGENVIEKYLVDNNIEYIREKQFSDCKDKQVLPFDFYIPHLNLCIEYDGEQHFREVKWFGGEQGFKKRIKHDKMKTEYCKENNINLLRIPYTEFKNIEEILRKAIS